MVPLGSWIELVNFNVDMLQYARVYREQQMILPQIKNYDHRLCQPCERVVPVQTCPFCYGGHSCMYCYDCPDCPLLPVTVLIPRAD